MMWMHHHQDRVLRSPEGEGSGAGGEATGQQGGAPQGAPPSQPQGQPAPGEYVPRSMFEEAKGTRDAAKERARVAEAENARLAAELEQFKRGAQAKPPETNQPKPAPDGAAELRDRLDKLELERKQDQQAERQRTLSKQIAASVPDEKRHSLIPTIIRDLHPNGLPDGDVNALAATLLTTIKGQHPSLFDLPAGSPRTAQQVGPTGQINWAEVRSLAEAPPGAKIPTEVYERLRGNNQGNTGLILGSRAQRPSK
jgi:hypothetical protein